VKKIKYSANHHFELAEFIGIIVSHQVFVKPKIERLRISSHLKVANVAIHCMVNEVTKNKFY
jgi:hypothetical protein